MFHLGTPEIIIIMALALIVFGPKKLPEIGKSIGGALREIKKASKDVTEALDFKNIEEEIKTEWETPDSVSYDYEKPYETAETSNIAKKPDEVEQDNKESVDNVPDSDRNA